MTDNPSAFHFSRVHQHTCAVLQHILHVLSHWAGYMAGVLLAALLQGKEADWVEQPLAPFLTGSCLAVFKHTSTSTLFGLASANNSKFGQGGSNCSFHSCQRKSTKIALRKKRSTCLFRGWNMKSTVGRNTLRDMEILVRYGHPYTLQVSLCSVLNVASYWIRSWSFNQLSNVWLRARFEWTCHERMSFALLLMYLLFAIPSIHNPWCPLSSEGYSKSGLLFLWENWQPLNLCFVT